MCCGFMSAVQDSAPVEKNYFRGLAMSRRNRTITLPVGLTLEQVKAAYIAATLKLTGGHQQRAADILCCHRHTVMKFSVSIAR